MTEQSVFEMYRSLQIGKNPICESCRQSAAEFYGPIGIWQVGTQFGIDELKILFVGKAARGDLHARADCDLAEHGFIDARSEADDWVRTYSRSAYWTYTRYIIENVYGSAAFGWDRIAFTNLVKCNNSMGLDYTTPTMKKNCLERLGVFGKEVEILRPKTIVFYAGQKYDAYIEKSLSQMKIIEDTGITRVPMGNKKVTWRSLIGELYGEDIRLLITGHPERVKKEDFVDRVSRWISKT